MSQWIKIKQKNLETHMTMPFLVYILYKRRGVVTAFLSRIMIPIQKPVNLSTISSSQRDQWQGHKSAIYLQKCLPGKDILLELLSHS